MMTEQLDDDNAYGCTLSASGDRVLLQLERRRDGEAIRVSMTRQEARRLITRLSTLELCLPDGPEPAYTPPKNS